MSSEPLRRRLGAMPTSMPEAVPPKSGAGPPAAGRKTARRRVDQAVDAPYVDPVILLGQQIRQIYAVCMRQVPGNHRWGIQQIPAWDGGTDRFGRRTTAIWPNIAKKLLVWGVEPFSFIRAQFALRQATPTPTDLMGATALDVYHRFASEEANVQRRFDSDILAIRQSMMGSRKAFGWDYVRSLRFALLDVAEVRASPLMRFLLGLKEGLEDVVGRFEEPALVEYAFRQADYDGCDDWAELLPASIKQRAAGFREAIVSGD